MSGYDESFFKPIREALEHAAATADVDGDENLTELHAESLAALAAQDRLEVAWDAVHAELETLRAALREIAEFPSTYRKGVAMREIARAVLAGSSE